MVASKQFSPVTQLFLGPCDVVCTLPLAWDAGRGVQEHVLRSCTRQSPLPRCAYGHLLSDLHVEMPY